MTSSRSPTSTRTPLSKAREFVSHIGFATSGPTAGGSGGTSDAAHNKGQHYPPRPTLAGVQDGTTDNSGRRPSVQFLTSFSEAALQRTNSDRSSNPPRMRRRMSSPPPPSTYNRGVSFDTFDNRDATDFSLTLNYKHKDYQHTRRSRTFLCGTDQNDYSEFALEWLIEELVDDGDEIVCLRVVEKDSKIASDTSVEQGKYREEAQKLLDQVIAKNKQDEKAISLIMELAVGKVQDIIQRMIQIYEPAVLVVGTRGRNLGGMQGLLPGSVSKYCLQQSPIPVIVVRPSTKRMKKKKKRQADPTRRDYNHILELSEAQGGRVLDNRHSVSLGLGSGPILQSSKTDQEEAAAVAKAIGISDGEINEKGAEVASGAPLDRVTSGKSDVTSGPESPSPTGPLSPGPVVMKSPILESVDSPQLSETNSEDEEGEEDGGKGDGNDIDEGKARIENQPGRATGAVVDEVVVSSPKKGRQGGDTAVTGDESAKQTEENPEEAVKEGQPHTEGEG